MKNQSKSISPILARGVLNILNDYDFLNEEQKKLVYCSILKNARITINVLNKSYDSLMDIANELTNEATTKLLEQENITYKELANHIARCYYNSTEKQEKNNTNLQYASNYISNDNIFAVAECTEKDLYMVNKASKNLRSRNFNKCKQEIQHHFINYDYEDLATVLKNR